MAENLGRFIPKLRFSVRVMLLGVLALGVLFAWGREQYLAPYRELAAEQQLLESSPEIQVARGELSQDSPFSTLVKDGSPADHGVWWQLAETRPVYALQIIHDSTIAADPHLFSSFPHLECFRIITKGKQKQILTDDQFRHVLGCPALRSLSFSGHPLANWQIAAIAENKRIKQLAIDGADLDDADLARIGQMTQLEVLFLRRNSFTGAGICDALPQFRHLRLLDVGMCPVDDDFVSAAAKLPALTQLRLYNTHVSDSGVEALARFGCRLRSISLQSASFSPAALESLAKLPQLQEVFVSSSCFTKEDQDRFEAKRQGLRLHRF